jgi:hypothetical protein
LISIAVWGTACGYHVSGKSDLIPKNIATIAIPAFGNLTARPKLADRLAGALTREFITRTQYNIIADPNQADAVLQGAVMSYASYPLIFDPASGRATGVQISVTLQLTLTERETGKVIFSRPGFQATERYEISVDQRAFFEESDTAVERLSRDVARTVVSTILESF